MTESVLTREAPQGPAVVVRATAVGGGIGYLLIAAMALTSNDTAQRRLGGRRWRALHVAGLWVVFGIFVSSYGVLRLLPTRARVD